MFNDAKTRGDGAEILRQRLLHQTNRRSNLAAVAVGPSSSSTVEQNSVVVAIPFLAVSCSISLRTLHSASTCLSRRRRDDLPLPAPPSSSSPPLHYVGGVAATVRSPTVLVAVSLPLLLSSSTVDKLWGDNDGDGAGTVGMMCLGLEDDGARFFLLPFWVSF
ncbi:hypothetical protein PIB30_023959 [Stylosanthes scabra]|uniref:Uncharacterized protein n=1 Tax=Stylosanthes scabra TaxID=79078 RepID=A0ABU6X7V2_9FABA|nr:hypothetical protein [Stylosanthes scabra]